MKRQDDIIFEEVWQNGILISHKKKNYQTIASET